MTPHALVQRWITVCKPYLDEHTQTLYSSGNVIFPLLLQKRLIESRYVFGKSHEYKVYCLFRIYLL